MLSPGFVEMWKLVCRTHYGRSSFFQLIPQEVPKKALFFFDIDPHSGMGFSMAIDITI